MKWGMKSMKYVASDLHGHYEKYIKATELLNDDDELYIIGDVIDRGPGGIKILLDIMLRKNVFMTKGNHEYLLYNDLSELAGSDAIDTKRIISESLEYGDIGQVETLKAFSKLSAKEQFAILDYIFELPLYIKLCVNSKDYILVHAGLTDFDGLPIEYLIEDDLLLGYHNYDITHYPNKTLIIGHQPTRFIPDAEPDKIYRKGDTINIDCGLGFGGQLGVLCLDTNKEYYF